MLKGGSDSLTSSGVYSEYRKVKIQVVLGAGYS